MLGRASLVVAVLAAGCSRSATRSYVLVSNEDSGDVSVVDAARAEVVATIPVGKRPRGMRVSRDGRTLYVAVSGSPKGRDGDKGPRDDDADGIAVVDLDRGIVLRTLPAGRDPEAFDVTPDGQKLYVSNEETAEVTIVDVPTAHVLRTVKVGAEPEGVTVTPDGKLAFVTSESDGEVFVIDTKKDVVVSRMTTARRPRAVAFTPDGSQAFVTAELGGTLHVFDTASRAALGQVRTGGDTARPMGVAISPDGVHAYVANGRAGSIAIVDVPSRAVDKTIEHVGARPWGVALDGKKLWVAAGPDLALVDVDRGEVVKRIAVGRGPWGVAIARRTR